MSIDFQPRALSDIEMAVDELNQWQSTAGRRFVDRLNDTLARLELFPLLAGKQEPTISTFPELRAWLIKKDFGYLVFYVPIGDGISVIRILHGSRNF